MPTLVGRDAELARLRNLLDEAAQGRAVAALVSGDAGVGKSRLVAEVATLAAQRGFCVLTGQCAEIGDSVPYLPFADALRTAPADLEAAVKARPCAASSSRFLSRASSASRPTSVGMFLLSQFERPGLELIPCGTSSLCGRLFRPGVLGRRDRRRLTLNDAR